MNIFIFNDYEELGLFAKINVDSIISLMESQEKINKLDQFVKVFNNSKGGCGCNIKSRQLAAENLYASFVPSFFSENEKVVSFLKEALGSDVVEFKKSGGDQSGFFLI